MMRTIRHPWSFWLSIVLALVMASLTVAFNLIHVLGLLLGFALLALMRWVAIQEGKKEF